MRLFPALASVAVLAPLVSGCAHTLEGREDRVVVAVDSRTGGGAAPAVEVTEAPPLIINEAVTARPRLARTVTLGEGTSEPVYAATPQAARGEGQAGPNVVVNNNITVVSTPPAVYGYGGYGGFGGRTTSGPVGPVVREGYTRSTGSHAPWAPSGWEGAGRTAGPGQTPHVGGNWAPAPSHGPRAFK